MQKLLAFLVLAVVTMGLGPAPLHAQRMREGQNPPAFLWKATPGTLGYHWQVSRHDDFRKIEHEQRDLRLPVCCPPFPLASGAWRWRYGRYAADDGKVSWSAARQFKIEEGLPRFVLPGREEIRRRIPKTHPRLFLRPEELPQLRELAKGKLAAKYRALVRLSDRALRSPPATTEPKKYGPGIKRGSEAWRKVWWGNRTYTIRALGSAATLAFTSLLDGNKEHAALAKHILIDCARWDPRGATGYRYNDEAGMPYAYYLARTYTFLHASLSEEERKLCRDVILIRGREMYRHLCPGHLWSPYSSHANRAWHFLGELGIAFHGEIEEADDWLWFATRVFGASYPAWSDSDGGWHEGSNYWRSYIGRFTWWADIMKSAIGIDAFKKPYFAHAGDYAMYMQPPGTRGGGFGDLTARQGSRNNVQLMALLASAAQNPYWQWYVEAHHANPDSGGYVGFIRGATTNPKARAPTDLPTSKCFHGIGQAYLNRTLISAHDNVSVLFKSSPFGTQSHGYEAQNSFLLYAFGERLLIRSGRRDSYGSKHHRNWMWSTRSTNSVTADGLGQHKRSRLARGRITAFVTNSRYDYVEGEAGAAYPQGIEGFRRGILFLKPDLIVVHDRLKARTPRHFEWWLHAENTFDLHNGKVAVVRSGKAACRIDWLTPQDLNITQTDRFDPPPRPRIKLVEHHLTARTREPSKEAIFITVLRPYRNDQPTPSFEPLLLGAFEESNILECVGSEGRFRITFPNKLGARPSVEHLDADK